MPRQTTAPSRVLVIISTIVVVIALLLLSTGSAAAVPGPSEPYTVRTGDTLWDLAAERTPGGGDVRATVHTIKIANGLASSVIAPGQTLELPAPG
ncbi:MAG TPA: LysM peptidoglycan-binding domain-containing protein [Acidimicrobiia bacterium]